MLLGIGLHAARSFFPNVWPVQDVTVSPEGIFDEFVLAVHGFRMPLFYLLSGFFAALLWRRRGLGPLLGHRMKRVVVPLILGLILIVPTVRWVSERAIEDQTTDAGDSHPAAALGKVGATRALLDESVEVDARREDTGHAPIQLAAVTGAVEEEVPDVLARPGWLPPLQHLWFLWFLILFVFLFAPVAWLVDRFAARRDPAAAPSRWPWVLMWALVPVVVLPQLAMEGDSTIPAFGPDQSSGWRPIPRIFVYYLIFFAFGALMHGRTGRSGALVVDTIGRRWWLVLPLALVVFVVGLKVMAEGGDETGWVASVLQVGYAWLMIFGLMGLFRMLLSGERRGVRYLSDASYWMYLMHLTLVIALQSWVRTWDIPAVAKFLLIVATTASILLITYQLFVRYTPIGTMLNGKRTRPTKTRESLADAPSPPVSSA